MSQLLLLMLPDRQTQALVQLARVHNLLPSFLLVMVGAWVSTANRVPPIPAGWISSSC
jgi:uncharacterized membrane protein YqgA involved in biofilm formation